jgi:hypothetical protein
MSYGYLGDVIKNSMGLRWMGPVRYDCAGNLIEQNSKGKKNTILLKYSTVLLFLSHFAGARHFICHRSYEGTVSFLKDSSSHDIPSVCKKSDCHCVAQNDKMNMDNNESKYSSWKASILFFISEIFFVERLHKAFFFHHNSEKN